MFSFDSVFLVLNVDLVTFICGTSRVVKLSFYGGCWR